MYEYKVVKVNRVVDGDTIDLTIDLGFNLYKTERFRMMDYDAPETFRPVNEKEKEAGIKVKEFFETILALNPIQNLFVKTFKDTDIYGRYSCELVFKNEKELKVNTTIKNFMLENRFTKENLRKSI